MTERRRTIEWQDVRLCAAGAEGRSGLAFLSAIVEGAVPQPPISQTLRFRLAAVAEGFARFEGAPDESLCNPMGSVHGGIAATLLDSAMASAIMTTLDERTAYTTAQLAVHLVRPITAKVTSYAAEGRLVHRGGRVATAEGRLFDPEGALLAHGTTTCLLFAR